MIQICQLIRPPIFILVMFLAIAGLTMNWRFYKLLKSKYPDIYKALGEPTLFINYSIKNAFLINRFIWKRKYLEVGDSILIKRCDFLFIYGIVFWILLIVLFVLTIICF